MNIESVCQRLGCNRVGLAHRLGVSKSLISVWDKKQNIPLARQYQINDLLEGRIPLGVGDVKNPTEPYHTPESTLSTETELKSQDIDLSEIDDETKAFLSDF